MASSDIGKLSTAAPVAAFVVTGMVTTVLGPILPELLETWHLSDSAAGALFTAQFSGSLSAGALSGLLVSRIGDRRTLALGYATMCAGLLAIAAGAHAAGVAGAFAAGVGMGCVIPPTNLLVARGRPDRAASALGVLNLSWGIGAAGWPLVVSATVRLGAMRPALVGLALLCAAASVRRSPSLVRDPDAVGTDPRLAAPAPMARVALFGVLIWLYSGTEMALGGWLPELARRLPSAASTAGSAAVGAAFWGGLSAGRAAISVRLDRRYEDPAVFAGIALASCSLVLLITARSDAMVLAAAALGGIGLGSYLPGHGRRRLTGDSRSHRRSAARDGLARRRHRTVAGWRDLRYLALPRNRRGFLARCSRDPRDVTRRQGQGAGLKTSSARRVTARMGPWRRMLPQGIGSDPGTGMVS